MWHSLYMSEKKFVRVDSELYEMIKGLASAEHRSIEGQLHVLLVKVLKELSQTDGLE